MSLNIRRESCFGVPTESFDQRYQRMLAQRLNPLSDPEREVATQAVGVILRAIPHPDIRRNVQSDLVFRVLEGVECLDDARVKLTGYARFLSSRRTFDGANVIDPFMQE